MNFEIFIKRGKMNLGDFEVMKVVLFFKEIHVSPFSKPRNRINERLNVLLVMTFYGVQSCGLYY